jgi:hypothetical protein
MSNGLLYPGTIMHISRDTSSRRRVLFGAVFAAATALLPVVTASASVVTCVGVEATIVGTPGDDILEGTDEPDVIAGLGGKDVIRGFGGDDLLCGGLGGDNIRGGDGNDTIKGGKGQDAIWGGLGSDVIRSGAGNDWAFGLKGPNDSAHGGTGSDVCIAEAEDDCELDHRWDHEPERWRDLIDQHFGELADEAMIVMDCESRAEPFAQNPVSDASGLFQFLPSTWDRWNPRTPGWEGETPFHPEANIATAKRLVDASIEEGHDAWWQWSCKP